MHRDTIINCVILICIMFHCRYRVAREVVKSSPDFSSIKNSIYDSYYQYTQDFGMLLRFVATYNLTICLQNLIMTLKITIETR
jgi:hypothetical protein